MAQNTKARPLTGEQPGAAAIPEQLAEMIRVDHAGEYGAVRIYEGQLAVFRNLPGKRKIAADIEKMARDEEDHLNRFNQLIADRQVRPTALTPFWHAAGFALGAATALMGDKAAMACTAAIEEVIDEHYARQVATLDDMNAEPELRATIEKFRQEEVAHKDHALAAGAAETPGYALLSGAIKTACRIAIRVAEKV